MENPHYTDEVRKIIQEARYAVFIRVDDTDEEIFFCPTPPEDNLEFIRSYIEQTFPDAEVVDLAILSDEEVQKAKEAALKKIEDHEKSLDENPVTHFWKGIQQ